MIKSLIQQTKKCNIIKLLILLLLLFVTVLLFSSPQKYIQSVSNGLNIWVQAVLPALLPFFIITKTFTYLNILPYNNKFFKILAKLFKVPACGIYIFFMSIISGYPVGAKLIEEFYKNGAINSKQATKLVAICMTSGPLFIVGTVGCMFLGSVTLGFVLLISHILGSVINGLIFRNFITKDTSFEQLYSNNNTNNTNSNPLYDIMINSILSVLLVGGYISIFFMIIQMLNNTNILLPFEMFFKNVFKLFNIDTSVSNSFVNGLIELTQGCKVLAGLPILNLKKVVISSLLIGFGGFCVHLQSLTFLISSKVNIKFYFLSKVTQSIASAVCAYLIMLIFFR